LGRGGAETKQSFSVRERPEELASTATPPLQCPTAVAAAGLNATAKYTAAMINAKLTA
jgi:hypothetical protein